MGHGRSRGRAQRRDRPDVGVTYQCLRCRAASWSAAAPRRPPATPFRVAVDPARVARHLPFCLRRSEQLPHRCLRLLHPLRVVRWKLAGGRQVVAERRCGSVDGELGWREITVPVVIAAKQRVADDAIARARSTLASMFSRSSDAALRLEHMLLTEARRRCLPGLYHEHVRVEGPGACRE